MYQNVQTCILEVNIVPELALKYLLS